MKLIFPAIALLFLCACSHPDPSKPTSDSAASTTTENPIGLAQLRAYRTYGEVSNFQEGMARVIRNDSVGYIDESGKLVIPLSFKEGGLFSEGLCAIINFDESVAYIDKTGKTVFTVANCLNGYDFNKGFAVIRSTQEKFGLIDQTGKLVVPAIYDQTSFNSGDKFIVDKGDNHWGIVDPSGKWVVEAKYAEINFVDEQGFCIARNEPAKYGMIDLTGKELVPFTYYNLYPFYNDRAKFLDKEGGKYGVINRKGEVVVPPTYDELENYSDGLACAQTRVGDGIYQVCFIDVDGKVVIPYKASNNAQDFHDGLVQFTEGGKMGYMDKTGKVVIAAKFDEADSFENGYARVAVNGEGFIIDKTGQRILY